MVLNYNTVVVFVNISFSIKVLNDEIYRQVQDHFPEFFPDNDSSVVNLPKPAVGIPKPELVIIWRTHCIGKFRSFQDEPGEKELTFILATVLQ